MKRTKWKNILKRQTFKLKVIPKGWVLVRLVIKKIGWVFLRKGSIMKCYKLIQVTAIIFVGLAGCMSNEEYNARLENTFSTECQRAGFQLNTRAYKLCMENKRDLNKIDQRNRLNSSINATTALPANSGSNFSFSYTVNLN